MSFRAFADALVRRARDRRQQLVILRSVDSTNRLARRWLEEARAEKEEPGSTWLVAWQQTAGRGRLGRQWTSEAGLGVYVTLLVPGREAPVPPALELLPMAVGVALCRAMRRWLDEVGLKWPNDLYHRGRKLGGILIEAVSGMADRRAVVIGFGVNHGHDHGQLPSAAATSLRVAHEQEGRGGEPMPSLEDLVWTLASAASSAVASTADPASLVAEYRELTIHRRGDRLRCSLPDREVDGVVEGFDSLGRLIVLVGEEQVALAAGEVVEGAGVIAAPADERSKG